MHSVEIDVFGVPVTIETGKLAKQANGSVVVKAGESVVLVSACANTKPKENADFFPLTVDYREYTYSAGRYPGGFIKREGRPSEKEVLTSRLIDRPIRPLFPEGFSHETQVIAMVLSADPLGDPSPLAIIGTAAALAISDIPFHHLLAGMRVAKLKGEYIAFPTYPQAKEATLVITVAGTENGIVMVEAGAQHASEADVVEAIDFGHTCCKKVIAGIKELVAKCGKTKWVYTPAPIDAVLASKIEALVGADLKDALNTEKYPKLESYAKVSACKDKVKAAATEMYPLEPAKVKEATKLLDALKEKIFREEMLSAKRRPDGRKFDQIRKITCEVGFLPRTHGSALFTRGETQALVTTTLGTKDDEQRIELLDPTETSKRFMLHYNFPPFSVGEVGFMRGAGRREIGHGILGERSLSAVVPSEKEFPYTVRIVSDILESNGSSSMASICGGTLSMMDAGVPIKQPIAGIAMGLVKEGDNHAILTDIAGAEDHYGDMDFKVAGSKDGITGLQMDIKVPNVTSGLMKEALEQARRARLEILDIMNATLSES